MKIPGNNLLLLLGAAALPFIVDAKAILGVDLGSLYMKVALVQRNAPLEIVTNLHSKRKTENMVLFDAGTRFYGADASSLIARKPLKTPSAMSVMLGRHDEHPSVQVSEWMVSCKEESVCVLFAAEKSHQILLYYSFTIISGPLGTSLSHYSFLQ